MKFQTGLRVDGFVFDGFKELCRGERMLVGEAVQRLMEACLKVGSVALVLRVEGLVDAGKRKLMETFCFFGKKLGAWKMFKYHVFIIKYGNVNGLYCEGYQQEYGNYSS
ncbi:MAG: hypothetical protein QMD13_00100 [Candidatus Bathyarchaeia archaeon]|nr:hypothetical protein [Candidatus Bathyarchaeia archaeon]